MAIFVFSKIVIKSKLPMNNELALKVYEVFEASQICYPITLQLSNISTFQLHTKSLIL